jgi:RHS repeat-associated protein
MLCVSPRHAARFQMQGSNVKRQLKQCRVAVTLLLSVSACITGTIATAAETTTYVLPDAQGTVLAREDAHGNIIARYDYRPYGAQQTGPRASAPGYTGHVNDADSGLVYMQARYYDPLIGRFLSTDPMGPSPANLQHFNRYSYAYNNPVRFTDPDGRCPWCAAAGIAGTMLVGAGVGAGTDYLVQKAINPGKPVNVNEVKVAAALGAFSAGTGMLAVGAVRTGVMSISKAVATNVAANGVAGATGRAVQGKLDGAPATTAQIVSAGVGNATGTLLANGVGVALGDFSRAASQAAATKMASAPINSPAGVGSHIVNTTASVGIGAQQGTGQAAASQAGQAVVQGAVNLEQAKYDEVQNR